MPSMTMRDRILAVVTGCAMDQVPFVMYDGVLSSDEVLAHLGFHRIGLLRWLAVHRVEHPHCRFVTDTFYVGSTKWQRTTLFTPKGSTPLTPEVTGTCQINLRHNCGKSFVPPVARGANQSA